VQALEYWRGELGGQTLQEHALLKIRAGLIDPRMAEKVVGHLGAEVRHGKPRLNVVESVHVG
jgi:hypothetical protein